MNSRAQSPRAGRRSKPDDGAATTRYRRDRLRPTCQREHLASSTAILEPFRNPARRQRPLPQLIAAQPALRRAPVVRSNYRAPLCSYYRTLHAADTGRPDHRRGTTQRHPPQRTAAGSRDIRRRIEARSRKGRPADPPAERLQSGKQTRVFSPDARKKPRQAEPPTGNSGILYGRPKPSRTPFVSGSGQHPAQTPPRGHPRTRPGIRRHQPNRQGDWVRKAPSYNRGRTRE